MVKGGPLDNQVGVPLIWVRRESLFFSKFQAKNIFSLYLRPTIVFLNWILLIMSMCNFAVVSFSCTLAWGKNTDDWSLPFCMFSTGNGGTRCHQLFFINCFKLLFCYCMQDTLIIYMYTCSCLLTKTTGKKLYKSVNSEVTAPHVWSHFPIWLTLAQQVCPTLLVWHNCGKLKSCGPRYTMGLNVNCWEYMVCSIYCLYIINYFYLIITKIGNNVNIGHFHHN